MCDRGEKVVGDLYILDNPTAHLCQEDICTFQGRVYVPGPLLASGVCRPHIRDLQVRGVPHVVVAVVDVLLQHPMSKKSQGRHGSTLASVG